MRIAQSTNCSTDSSNGVIPLPRTHTHSIVTPVQFHPAGNSRGPPRFLLCNVLCQESARITTARCIPYTNNSQLPRAVRKVAFAQHVVTAIAITSNGATSCCQHRDRIVCPCTRHAAVPCQSDCCSHQSKPLRSCLW